MQNNGNLIPALIPICNKPVKAEIRLIPVLFLFHAQNCCEREFFPQVPALFLCYSCIISFLVNFPNCLKTDSNSNCCRDVVEYLT